jgi:hypothetical protein
VPIRIDALSGRPSNSISSATLPVVADSTDGLIGVDREGSKRSGGAQLTGKGLSIQKKSHLESLPSPVE